MFHTQPACTVTDLQRAKRAMPLYDMSTLTNVKILKRQFDLLKHAVDEDELTTRIQRAKEAIVASRVVAKSVRKAAIDVATAIRRWGRKAQTAARSAANQLDVAERKVRNQRAACAQALKKSCAKHKKLGIFEVGGILVSNMAVYDDITGDRSETLLEPFCDQGVA